MSTGGEDQGGGAPWPLKSLALEGAFRGRILEALHRYRNRNTLTVIGFHRVLPENHPEMATAMDDFTVSTDVFEETLRFLRRFYAVVSMEEVLDAHRGHIRLPDRAATVTFDDGWADTEEHAAPILRRLGVPATLFLSGGILDGAGGFWREDLYAAAAALPAGRFNEIWERGTGLRRRETLADNPGRRSLIADAEAIPPAARERLIAQLKNAATPPIRSSLMGPEQVKSWTDDFDIGGHGYYHDPLTDVADPEGELDASREVIRRLRPYTDDGSPTTMSFPHGRYDARVVAAAHDVGYELVFTSDACTNVMEDGRPVSRVLGRLFGTTRYTTSGRRFSSTRTANFFFRARRRVLDRSGNGSRGFARR